MTIGPLDDKGLPAGYPFDADWEITPRDAKKALAAGPASAVLIDVRTPGEHETARIPGAILVPMNELQSRLADLRRHEDALVITHCHHGRRSLRAAEFLRSQGMPRVLSMAGGIELWSTDIDPAVPRY